MSDAVEGLFQPVFTTNPTVEGTGLGQPIRDDIRIAAAPASDQAYRSCDRYQRGGPPGRLG